MARGSTTRTSQAISSCCAFPTPGCNPRGLMLARGKDLSKKLVAYHRIPVPAFAVFPMRRKVRRPARLGFPLIVKRLSEDASLRHRAGLGGRHRRKARRARRFHPRADRHGRHREQYVEGRELYVGVLGNDRLRVLPVWELEFGEMAPAAGQSRRRRSSTTRLSGTARHHAGAGQGSRAGSCAPASSGSPSASIGRWRLDGYARIDFRLPNDGIPYFLEANPNPEIAETQEFSKAALHDGLAYRELLQRILGLGIRRAMPAASAS